MSEVKKIATRASYGAALVELGKKSKGIPVTLTAYTSPPSRAISAA